LNRRPLYTRKPNQPTRTRGIGHGGLSGYTYRREAGVELQGEGGGDKSQSLPTLYVSKKLAAKNGILFKNAPMWNALKDDDRDEGHKKMRYSETSVKSQKKLDEVYSKIVDGDKKTKKRRRQKRDPSVKKVREHMRKMIAYHEKVVDEEIPSIYPILGPCCSDSEGESEEGNGEDEKRSCTKREMWKK